MLVGSYLLSSLNVIKTIQLGLVSYTEVWEKMREFTDNRDETTPDEIWLVEHPAVFTQGQAGKPEHLLNPGNIPVIQSDRGGQITYHGPGQLVAYTLIDIKRRKMTIRQLVNSLEKAVIQTLAVFNVTGTTRCDAPGVYVRDAKICSIGLRIRQGCAYHGLAFNIQMDLSPFQQINPCGFKNLPMIQLSAFTPDISINRVTPYLIKHLIDEINAYPISQAFINNEEEKHA